MISEKCKTTYAKLNTFVTNVINRDVTPQLTSLDETTTSLQESKLDNKEYITTSFTPLKVLTYYGDDGDDIITNKGNSIRLAIDDRVGFRFSCNTNEYYQFNITVTTNTVTLYDDSWTYEYGSLSVGSHTIKVTKNELIVDNTTIKSDFDGKLGVVNTMKSIVDLTLSSKAWYHEATFFDKIYPIGCVHITTNSVNPSNYFDGEWERIQDTFLLASGTTYENGSTGGSATVTLTSAQSGVPAHNHTYAHTDTTYKANTTSRKPGTATAANYVTSITGTANNTTKTSSNNTAQNAAEAHNNMPPYLAVYMWERVG